ncbi:zinc ABC transporter substrate-binding protein, partial [bacterium]|nr:zinc ABC transporter substrate-binding protein [bacterium]
DDRDPHIWLDPANVITVAEALSARLSLMAPDKAEAFERRTAALVKRLRRLNGALEKQFEPVAKRGFVVFHPAYSHMVSRYGLNQLGYISITPEQRSGAKKWLEINRLAPVCVVGEVGQPMTRIQQLAKSSDASVVVLDPLDSLEKSQNIVELIQTTADALVQCLDTPA